MEKKVYEGYKRTSTSITETGDSVTDVLPKVRKNTTPKEPRKRTTARVAGKSTVAKPRLAMFIDVDNVGITRENLLEILFFANGKFQIELCKLYGFSDDTLPGIRDFASEYNVITAGKMKFKQPGVNSLDSRLLIDAYECALNNKNKIDLIFVWCYPCDLENLFEKITNLGINTATIDNAIFDCKNKFVSQTFKLYSPYHFTVEQSTYGKVRNEPDSLSLNENMEVQPLSNKQTQEIGEESSVPNNNTETVSANKPVIDEDVVPPVLPRRQILERSNPNSAKLNTEPNTQPSIEETDAQSSSLVEEIARKLNLDISTEDNSSAEETEKTPSSSELFMDMLKQAGFDDYLEKDQPLKYEDTIGDL